ncbi:MULTISPECIES: hypothetical protein [unclassified Pedobacter]|uniref:hypothetical protein n=1 Tax=unclassified Pedobacter TaxID=2628915 RepID=UPI001BE64909|nr:MULTISPECIES: hypothetical protein [unclassified Pedobacter]MBT2560409.1 hypothetical protein [Pedobacter sp. ISL-64]
MKSNGCAKIHFVPAIRYNLFEILPAYSKLLQTKSIFAAVGFKNQGLQETEVAGRKCQSILAANKSQPQGTRYLVSKVFTAATSCSLSLGRGAFIVFTFPSLSIKI